MWSMRSRVLRISRAWISMSDDWPSKPADGWWIRMRLFGSERRLPAAPPARSSEPMDIATPQLVVHGLAEEDDPLVEESRVDVVLALAAGAALDDGGDKGHGGGRVARRRYRARSTYG